MTDKELKESAEAEAAKYDMTVDEYNRLADMHDQRRKELKANGGAD